MKIERVTMMIVAAVLLAAASAGAQGADEQKGYLEGVAQAAFGNVTSQSYGAEAGVRVYTNTFIYGEFGYAGDTAPSTLGATAQQIAAATTTPQGSVAYSAKQPMTFFDAGIRYQFPAAPKVSPYVMAGFGVAKFKHDVTFTAGGSDITSSMSTYGVVLGSDLSGTETAALLVLGGGVQWTPMQRLVVDLQFRYGRASTEGEATNVSRAGIGIGVRF